MHLRLTSVIGSNTSGRCVVASRSKDTMDRANKARERSYRKNLLSQFFDDNREILSSCLNGRGSIYENTLTTAFGRPEYLWQALGS